MIDLNLLYKAIKQRLRIVYAKGLPREEIEMELRLDIEQILQLVLSEDLPESGYYTDCDNNDEYAFIDEEEIHEKIDSQSQEVLDLAELMKLAALGDYLDLNLDLDDDSE